MSDKAQIGKAGEDFCEKIYIKSGYKIIGRNIHSRFGEIDIIAENENYVVFVEVKTRCEVRIGDPREAVTAQKQKKIILTALWFLQNRGLNKQPRFDVLEVIHRDGKICKYRKTENAFEYNERIHGKFDF